MANSLTREEVIEELSEYGIEGVYVYLIDIIPLIEIMWADGKVQDAEVSILNDYLKKIVERINLLACGAVISLEEAQRFAGQFLQKRPGVKLLEKLRSYVSMVRLKDSDKEYDEKTDSLLAACLDIASSSVISYPYGMGERFNADEKRCFFEILDSIK